MAGAAVTTTPDPHDPRRAPLGIGSLLRLPGGQRARLLSWTRSGDGTLSALIDHGDRLERLPLADMFGAALTGSPAPDPPLDPRLQPPPTPEFEELPPAAKDKIINYVRHLLQVDTGSLTGTPDLDRLTGSLDPRYDPETTSVTERVLTKAAELRALGVKPNSRAALFKDRAKLNKHGMSAFVHGNRVLGGDRLARHDPRVVEVGRQFLTTHKKHAHIDNRALAVQLHGALLEEDLGHDLSAYGVRRLLGDLSRGKGLDKPAASRRTHENKPVVVYDRWRVAAPCEHIQIDGYRTAIMIWSPEAGWATATILTAIDVYTRAPLALRVITSSGTGPTARDAAGLLWDIGRPTVTRAGWPYELQYHHGIPQLVHIPSVTSDPDLGRVIGYKIAGTVAAIVLDHGSEFTSAHLLGAASRMGTDVLFCPPYAPHHKGVVERLHGTYKHIEALLGAEHNTGSNPLNRADGVTDRVVLTKEDLHDILWTYLLQIYMHTPHEGLRDTHDRLTPLTPAMILEEYLTHAGTLSVPSDPWAFIHALDTREVSLQDYGITIDRRRYNGPELLELRGHLQRGLGLKPRTVTVYFDRYDVSRIYLRHVVTGEWIVLHRAEASAHSLVPYSDLLTRVAAQSGTTAQPLTSEELHRAEVEFHLAWGHGAFADRRTARLAAIEASRAHTLAHDLADAGPEFLTLAYPTPQDTETTYPDDSDDLLDYDEIFADEDNGHDDAAWAAS